MPFKRRGPKRLLVKNVKIRMDKCIKGDAQKRYTEGSKMNEEVGSELWVPYIKCRYSPVDLLINRVNSAPI